MKKVRIGVAGLRFGRTHVELLRSLSDEAELAAVCSASEEDRAYAESIGTAFYSDYREMIDRERLDGLCVAVPPALHAELAVYAMEHGTNVLVEKPIATSPEEAEQIAAAAERTGKKALVNFQRRFDPSVVALREAMASGEAGRPVGFVLHGAYVKEEEYFRQEYRQHRQTGGGVISINGAHDLDMIRYLCGEVRMVSAMKGNVVRGYEVEDTAAVSLLCENGAVGTLFLSDCAHPAAKMTHTIYLERRTYAFNCSSLFGGGDHTLVSCRVDGKTWETLERTAPAVSPHRTQMQHFLRVLRGQEDVRVTPRDAIKSLRLMLAVQEALDTGKTVAL